MRKKIPFIIVTFLFTDRNTLSRAVKLPLPAIQAVYDRKRV